MVKFFRVKEKARGLARQQKFDQALAEYRTAIAQAETDHDSAALRNLYNAAGDASLLRSDAATAVEFFEKAADLYLEEGLYDNAIALCHKILRHVPTRADAYAKLGRIYAEKGLRNESIQNWLEFAERRQKANDAAGVTRALREVVALSPDSDSVRLQLVEGLLALREGGEALPELEELRTRAERAGETARAAELAERIASIRREYGLEPARPAAPKVEPPKPQAREDRPAWPPPAEGPETFGNLGVTRQPEPLAPPLGAGSVAGLDSGFGFSGGAPSLAPPGTPAEPGAEAPPHLEPPAAGSAGAKEGATAAATPPETHAEPLAARGPAGAGLEQGPAVESLPGFTLPEAGAGGAAAAPEAGESEEAAPGGSSFPFVAVEERIARAEARLAENPHDAEERIYLAELYQEAGDLDLARSAMAQGAAELLLAGHAERAWRTYRRLAGLAPDEIEVVQKLVEVAQALGTREHLVQSYELLGDRLMDTGQFGRAAEVHRRVLEIDPNHRRSQDQLLLLEGLESPAPAAPATGAKGGRAEEDYVDLGRLISEGEPTRVTDPRMTARTKPTGDEEADLQAVIEAFRQGVEANIEEGDHESHYDLGVAFRQMGLLDEAVREFQLAARGSEHRERAFEMMGLCFMEKGMVSVAVNCFRRGIEGERDPHEGLGLHYHLARSLEELGQREAAREEYERVVALDVRFMDAAERLKRLA
jgi:tetratricopeptide (TPR) repeat protein